MLPPINYFGGKARIAPTIWKHFGKPTAYIECFSGMAATLLQRPDDSYPSTQYWETINDIDSVVANFHRSCQLAPEAVVSNALDPPIEIELLHREGVLSKSRERLRLMLEDSKYHEPELAGWYLYVQANSIRPTPCIGTRTAKKPPLQPKGALSPSQRDDIFEVFDKLSKRIQHLRILCRDYRDLLVDAEVKVPKGHTVAVLCDPPYKKPGKKYANGTFDYAPLLKRCVELGRHKNIRIALCGYVGDYNMPEDWKVDPCFKTAGGHETVWYSPGCKKPEDSNHWENKGVVGNVFEEMYAEPPHHPLERVLSILRREEVEE